MPDEQIWEHFWKRVDDAFELRDVSEREISRRSFMSYGAFHASRKDRLAISIGFLEGICRTLDVDAHYLLTGFGEPRPFIPESVRVENPDKILDAARKKAKGRYRPEALEMVLSFEPDPRLGVDRLVHLVKRADEFLRDKEARARGASRGRRKSAGAAGSPKERRKRLASSR